MRLVKDSYSLKLETCNYCLGYSMGMYKCRQAYSKKANNSWAMDSLELRKECNIGEWCNLIPQEAYSIEE